MTDQDDRLRIDKWLWSARFFKTRSLAADAVESGKVTINGARVKPARALKVDDEIAIQTAFVICTVRVAGLSARRGPAAEAAKLYVETEDSKRLREQARAARVSQHPDAYIKGRPTKRDRRRIQKIRGEPL
jgi:ribosome-associated heat shock protein Hsp15